MPHRQPAAIKRPLLLAAAFAFTLLLSGCLGSSEQQTRIVFVEKCGWDARLLPLLTNGWRLVSAHSLPEKSGHYVLLQKP